MDDEAFDSISPLFQIFFNGFDTYYFENSKEDYENIKYLSFIFLYNYKKTANVYFSSFLNNFKDLLENIVYLDYLDRIKILITFSYNYYLNIFPESNEKDKNKKSFGPSEENFVSYKFR